MRIIETRNVHQVLPTALAIITEEGIARNSRNGPVRVVDGPVTTLYNNPTERVMFWVGRDANPFFHFFESLWMLAGRNDVSSAAKYAGNMKSYTDDGRTFHGAYGHRWINHFGMNQLGIVAQRLKADPDDRRCVVQMWDAQADLGKEGKDYPCNTQIYFSRNFEGALDMTVCNRSNDIIWGAYGANAVHFSVLQEFMAAWIGCPVGSYWQMSNNWHAYENTLKKTLPICTEPQVCPYEEDRVSPYPLVSTPIDQWLQDLGMMLDEGVVVGLRDPFFRRVATPILMAHRHWRENKGEDRYLGALEILTNCKATDWRLACEEWIQRRYEKFKRAADDGPTQQEQ